MEECERLVAVSAFLFLDGAKLTSFWSEHSKKLKFVEDALSLLVHI